MSEVPQTDEVTGKPTTGHEWDGISELNTPLPRWWLNVFYATILFSIGYFIIYPSWPYFTGERWTYTGGLADYSQRDAVAEELRAARSALDAEMAAMRAASVEDILADERLRRIANQAGASHFGDNCAPCHGSGAQGGRGFPNLRDDDWLWGGELGEIHFTIQHGIRWEEDMETRFSEMPAFLRDEILSEDEIRDVLNHVRRISGQDHDAARAARGAAVFEAQCAVCHGEDGNGLEQLGAPNLTDAIWLYGGDEEALYSTIAFARNGVMPAWRGRLDPVAIKQLALYVHLLGGGETRLPEGGDDAGAQSSE